MKESFQANLDAKGRILIPVYFRERLGVKKGDTLKIEAEKADEAES